jgi:hypothetical protein
MKHRILSQTIAVLAAGGLVVGTPAAAAVQPPYELAARFVSPASGELVGASGTAAWTAGLAGKASGLTGARIEQGRITGTLAASAARFGVEWPAPGADLDLGFNDFVDIEILLPQGFKGGVFIDYVAEGQSAEAPGRIVLPVAAMATGRIQAVRVDVGLVPGWRGMLKQAALVIAPVAGGAVGVGRILVGDAPGAATPLDLNLNLKPGMKVEDLKRMESKHGCIWWTAERETKGFKAEVMPRRALRMMEESWQVYVNLLGYRDPCLAKDGKTRGKINQVTWYDGFWMGGDKPLPYLNVSEGGLHDEGYGNPMPHEFAHCVQGGQIDFLRGAHWESHANYLRFLRNEQFFAQVGNEPMPFETLRRATFFQDHPRLIYADFRPYFYLDGDPDKLGLGPNFVAKLWQTGEADELLWDRLAKLLPAGVTRETVAAGIARSWVTFDFPAGKYHRESYFTDDAAGRIRRFRYATPLVAMPDRPGTFAAPLGRSPLKFGWNVHDLTPSAKQVQAVVTGVDIQGEGESWRWGFVALRKSGESVVSPIYPPGPGSIELPADVASLSMFVVATPADAVLPYPRLTPAFAVDRHPQHRRYPYEVQLKGALPASYALALNEPNGAKHPNGGGFVGPEAKVDASAFVGPEAQVLGRAKVLGQARILDHAVVMGSATVKDEAVVSGSAVVNDRAVVSEQARVRNFAYVGGDAKVRERSRVGDSCDIQMSPEISGDAVVRGMAQPLERGKVSGFAILDADYSMEFNLSDGVHYHHIPWGAWYFDEFAGKLSKPRGLVASYQFDETGGGQALDEFGSLHAQVRGEPGRAGGSLVLDKPGQYVVLDSSLVDAPAVTWTMEVIVDGATTQPLLAVNDWKKSGVLLGLGENGRFAAVLALDGQPPVTLVSSVPAARGALLSVALRLDGQTVSIFQGGKKVAEKGWEHGAGEYFHDAGAPSPTRFLLGMEPQGRNLRGKLASFRAYNIALSDAELASPAAAQ